MSSMPPIPGSRVLEEVGRLHVQFNQQIEANQQLAQQNMNLQKQLQEVMKENVDLKAKLEPFMKDNPRNIIRDEDASEVISKHNYREAAETKQPA